MSESEKKAYVNCLISENTYGKAIQAEPLHTAIEHDNNGDAVDQAS